MNRPIARLKKNPREQVRVASSEFEEIGQGFDMRSGPIYYDGGSAEMKPNWKGTNISAKILPQPVVALRRVEDEAEARTAELVPDKVAESRLTELKPLLAD